MWMRLQCFPLKGDSIMFKRENIKFNAMIYMMLWFGYTFYDYGAFINYLIMGPVIGNIILNSTWLYLNLMIGDKTEAKNEAKMKPNF